jgi:kinetochore protein NNF1
MPSADMERSPSPPSAPPVQSTPGVRAEALTKVYTNALESTLNSVSYPSFSACFPSIAKNAPKQLEAMHKGMCERLRGFAMAEFGEIIEERRAVERLNELEGLIADARKRKSRSVEGDEGKGEVA